MARYKCLDDHYSNTFSVWGFVMSYGCPNLGAPPICVEPKVSGLLKDDAVFWAQGQIQMMIDGGRWKVVERGPDRHGTGRITILSN